MRLAGVIREGNLFDQPGSREPGRGPARVLWPARYRALLETKRKVSVSAARPAAMFITSFLMMRVPWIAGATGTHRIILQLSAQMVRLICRLSKGQFVPWSKARSPSRPPAGRDASAPCLSWRRTFSAASPFSRPSYRLVSPPRRKPELSSLPGPVGHSRRHPKGAAAANEGCRLAAGQRR